MTGAGVTFAGTDLYRVLEETLPHRFGGNAGDYQLVEEQDTRGLPRYNLLVNPELNLDNPSAVLQTLLDELAKQREAYRLMANLWSQAGVLHISRNYPIRTSRGKVLPFRTLGH